MPRWAWGIITLLIALGWLPPLFEARYKRHFFIGRYRVSRTTSQIFHVFGFVLCAVGAFLIFFGEK
jgi:hypothetical protein